MLSMATGDEQESQWLVITHNPELPELLSVRCAAPGWKAQGKMQAQSKPFPEVIKPRGRPHIPLLWSGWRRPHVTRNYLHYPRTAGPDSSGVSLIYKSKTHYSCVRCEPVNWPLLTTNMVMSTHSHRERQNRPTLRNSYTNKMWY